MDTSGILFAEGGLYNYLGHYAFVFEAVSFDVLVVVFHVASDKNQAAIAFLLDSISDCGKDIIFQLV